MKKARILVLMDKELIPPESVPAGTDLNRKLWGTEYDVLQGLKQLGHESIPLGVADDLSVIEQAISEYKPDLCFNLLEEFAGEAQFDQNIVSYLEMLQQPYSGCNPRGLMIARDKALTKKILHYHKIDAPQFYVSLKNRAIAKKPKNMNFPLIVKALNEEASFGISQASVVKTQEKLSERIAFIHEYVDDDAIIEQFIDGREIYVGVMGNQNLSTFPIMELIFDSPGTKKIYTQTAKFDVDYRKKHKIKTQLAKDIDSTLAKKIEETSKEIYRALDLSGYARMDFRLGAEGKVYLLEANPNPDISIRDDFARSMMSLGLSYEEVLEKILSLGFKRAKHMKSA